MGITKNPIFDGMEFVNRHSVTNEILTESTTIPIVVQDGKLKINSRDVGGSVSVLNKDEDPPPNPPTGIITLYVKGDVLYGKKSNGNILTFEYDTGVGDFTGSGVENGFAYWTAVDNISVTDKLLFNPLDSSITVVGGFFVQQGINIELTNGDATHGLKSSNGICIGNATGITPSSTEISLQKSNTYINCLEGKISGGVPSDILVTNVYIYGSNENGQLSVDGENRLQYNTFFDDNPTTPKNVILGTTDGVATRIPFFDTTNSLTSSAYLIFDGALKVNGVSVGDVSGSLTSGRIPVASGNKTLENSGLTYSGGTLSVTGNGIQTNKLRIRDTFVGTPYRDLINDWSASNIIKVTSGYGDISYIVKMFSDTSNCISVGSNTKLGVDSVNVGIGNSITSGGDAVFNNGVIVGNGIKISPIETDCDNSIILGNDAICHRSNEIVSTIDKTVVSKTVGESLTTYNANTSVKGEKSFYMNISMTDEAKTEVIFTTFNTSIILFEVKMNIFQIFSGVFSSVIFKGAVSVSSVGVLSFLKPHNDINSYALDSNSLNYTTETFSSDTASIPLELSLFGTNNIILSYDNSNGDAVRIDGVISYVESRF